MNDSAVLKAARVLVPLFLVIQAGVVFWASGGERPPAPAELAAMPRKIADWEFAQEFPIEPEVAAQLRADRLLNRTYVEQVKESWMANLFVAWFRTQRGGAAPHSPQVCLPGSGWVPLVTDKVAVDSPAGNIIINRYITVHGQERAIVLYWYQTSHRAIASEWEAKFWILPDAVTDRRTDTSLVRVTVWPMGRSDEVTTAAAIQFTSKMYPYLMNLLPH
jgi:EpsI family protein